MLVIQQNRCKLASANIIGTYLVMKKMISGLKNRSLSSNKVFFNLDNMKNKKYNIFICNKVKFLGGTLFDKFFMISLPLFASALLFLDLSVLPRLSYHGSLIEEGGEGIYFSIFIACFVVFYPIRNWIGINNIIKKYKTSKYLTEKERVYVDWLINLVNK